MTKPDDPNTAKPGVGPRKRSRAVRRLLRALLSNVSELVLTAALALGFFLAFISILMLSFPKGSGLPGLYQQWIGSSRERSSLALRSGEEVSAHVAILTGVTRTVKDRPADAVAWKNAEPGMPIEDRHAIQTLSRSRASISFDDDSTLELRENSLVVVKSPERRRSARVARASLVVLGGRVHGRIGPDTLQGGTLDLMTAGATTQVRPEGENPAEYSIAVNPDDNTATLSVYSGVAEVTSAGETQLVERSQSITIVPDEPPGPTMWIPDAPRPLSPADEKTLVWGAVAPRVRFEWAASADAVTYRFVIARDRDFLDVLFDDVVDETSTVFGNFRRGWYYWKVHAQNGPAVSLPSSVNGLLVVRDADPPTLRVGMPDEVLNQSELVIRGVTDPGTEVLVGDETVAVSAAGEFEYVIGLTHGPNLVVIEAIDAAGNVAYHSQYVNARF